MESVGRADRRVARREKNSRAGVANCLHCGEPFRPRKAGHVFCSNECRHGGERLPREWESMVNRDPEAIKRLMDPSRDPDERVRPDDWHPHPSSPFFDLDLAETVASRRFQLQHVPIHKEFP